MTFRAVYEYILKANQLSEAEQAEYDLTAFFEAATEERLEHLAQVMEKNFNCAPGSLIIRPIKENFGTVGSVEEKEFFPEDVEVHAFTDEEEEHDCPGCEDCNPDPPDSSDDDYYDEEVEDEG